HEVEDDANAALMQCRHQPVEVGKRAEERIDVEIVGDVVAEIGHRRGIDRRDPDGVDPEPVEIIDAIEGAVQVADAVTIAVLKGARIDLIDDGLPPPWLLYHRWASSRAAAASGTLPGKLVTISASRGTPAGPRR